MIRVTSDRELSREIERIVALLQPEVDWATRTSAMQRLSGLLRGGALGRAGIVFVWVGWNVDKRVNGFKAGQLWV